MSKSTTKLRPLDDRIIVKRVEAEEKTKGGIFLPDTAKEKPQQGKVIAVGAGKLLDNGERATPDVKENDLVLFGKYSGTEVKVEGEEFIIMRESDVLAKL
jgi:chaperonin GroES